jgi:hypothetical protein
MQASMNLVLHGGHAHRHGGIGAGVHFRSENALVGKWWTWFEAALTSFSRAADHPKAEAKFGGRITLTSMQKVGHNRPFKFFSTRTRS